MNILVLGGTRFMGKHLVSKLLEGGHRVTVATRGQADDPFGDEVDRLRLDRNSSRDLESTLGGQEFDVVYDNLAFCSQDIRNLLEVARPGRYIMISSRSTYQRFGPQMPETFFDPLVEPVRWCTADEVSYGEGKRQAEQALFQAYAHIPGVAVRFPVVIGTDDYTGRLRFYVEHAIKGIPMKIANTDAHIPLVDSREAGWFLAHLAGQSFTGPINGANPGGISLREVLDYVAAKTGRIAVLADEGVEAPLNEQVECGLDLARAEALGFRFSPLKEIVCPLLDHFIAELTK